MLYIIVFRPQLHVVYGLYTLCVIPSAVGSDYMYACVCVYLYVLHVVYVVNSMCMIICILMCVIKWYIPTFIIYIVKVQNVFPKLGKFS